MHGLGNTPSVIQEFLVSFFVSNLVIMKGLMNNVSHFKVEKTSKIYTILLILRIYITLLAMLLIFFQI